MRVPGDRNGDRDEKAGDHLANLLRCRGLYPSIHGRGAMRSVLAGSGANRIKRRTARIPGILPKTRPAIAFSSRVSYHLNR